MIYLDDFFASCVPDYDFQEASAIITRRGRGDLLAGMQEIQSIWEEAQKNDQEEATQSGWRYEIKAYNVVFENMSKLFAPKEV